ncbi:MAG: hypothetical protein KGL35_15265 [Bradyrhizobium sp.]|nr:hypothetical protein [Bradyrhizobium sp.]
MPVPKGLKRFGMRGYQVGDMAIIRDRPWRWFVMPKARARYDGFFAHRFRSLREARAWAEGLQ